MYNSPINPFYSWRSQFVQFFRSKSILSILVIVNVAVWLILAITSSIVYLYTLLFNDGIHLTPIVHQYLGFYAHYKTALIHPWSIITSLFVHNSFWHLLGNMLLLVIAGHIYLKYKSGKSLLATYLIGGICGNLLFQLLYNISPVLRVVAPSVYIVGSSGAVLAILIAITLCQPNYPINLLFFGQIRLKWVTLILIGFLLIPLVNCDFRNIGGHFAHLGGALYGASVALWSHWGQKIFTRHPQKKKKKFYTSYQAGTPYTTPSQDDNEKRVEEILGKISKDGYSALSKEEKDFLFHYKKN